MKKKTLKIFVNSFIVSLFTIWVVNELFMVAPTKSSQDLTIPEQSIVLFLQSDAAMMKVMPQPVHSTALADPVIADDEEIVIDKGLFAWNGSDSQKYAISSVEDVADIPLEHDTAKNIRRPLKRPTHIKKITDSAAISAKAASEAPVSAPIVQASLNITPKQVFPETVQAKITEETNTLQLAQATEDAFIPLQRGETLVSSGKIEITREAPQSQVAMAGDTVAAGTIAIQKGFEEPEEAPRIWHSMEESAKDTPWVVAQGVKHPKNSQIKDDFAQLSESEIQEILNKPESMQDGEEVQVSEMVKNILIPIPENILNDKNLTPQLVSPKKSAQMEEAENNSADDKNNDEKKGGILKSLTSIFGGNDSDNNTEVVADEDGKVVKKAKRGGLLSAFTEEKSSFKKILPAEMKLSFQPGRAEISGQTLRWIEAFANKAIEDDKVILQIRIDQTSSFELQQKRLNLLHNILTNKGVGYHKIDTVLTSREPNSFIIRTLKINDNINNDTLRANNRKIQSYQSW